LRNKTWICQPLNRIYQHILSSNDEKMRQLEKPAPVYCASWRHQHKLQASFIIAVCTLKLSVSHNKQQIGGGHPELSTTYLALFSLNCSTFIVCFNFVWII
jgi:hypothetical protein